MNPVVKVITSVIIAINKLIDGLDSTLVSTIKKLFFLTVFILTFIGIIIGARKGQDAARIKSPPIAEYTKDLFINDISRERKNVTFRYMLDNKVIAESKSISHDKIHYSSKVMLEPELDKGIIEMKEERRKILHPELKDTSRPFEGRYRPVRKHDYISELKREDRKIKSNTGNENDRGNKNSVIKKNENFKSENKLNIMKDEKKIDLPLKEESGNIDLLRDKKKGNIPNSMKNNELFN